MAALAAEDEALTTEVEVGEEDTREEAEDWRKGKEAVAAVPTTRGLTRTARLGSM